MESPTQTTVELLQLIDTTSLFASIASLLLAVIAIALSITFFIMSLKHSKEATEASKDIQSGVGKLEAIFDRLYSDTFSMMKDTYSDLRKHAWNSNALNTPLAGKQDVSMIGDIEDIVNQEISKVLEQSNLTDEDKDKISSQIDEKLKVIEKKLVWPQFSHIQYVIMRTFFAEHKARSVKARDIFKYARDGFDIPSVLVMDVMLHMKHLGKLNYGESLTQDAEVTMPAEIFDKLIEEEN